MTLADTVILEHYLAPFRAWLAEPGVTELVVNRPGEIGLEAQGTWRWISAPEIDVDWLVRLAIAAAAYTRQDVSDAEPLCATTLPDGERCQIVLPPAAEHVSLTIRKPSAEALGLDDLATSGLFQATAATDLARAAQERRLDTLKSQGDWPAFLQAAVESRRNILISGATGSGKTTLAKALLRHIPHTERILTLEDARELTVPHRNCVHLLYSKSDQGRARVDAHRLLEAALRMRPDRILLQELRDEAAYFYLRNVSSGHPGSITTLHADSAALAFEQLALLVKESAPGRRLAREEILALLRRLVDVVVHMRRDGAHYRVTEVWHEPVRQRALAV